ncbi:MAG: DUF4340 domain-containing protein [Bacteroidetes bacterium]|nr:DUF4340 domain-containing protein [Bacteroidota bacterium]
MLNKFNTKTLLVILVLLVAGAAIKFLSDSGETKSTLPDYLVEVDTNGVTKLTFQPKGKTPYNLVRNDGKWKLELANGKLVPIVSSRLTSVLMAINSMKPKKKVTDKPEKWSKYEVDDTTGTKVLAYAGEEEVASLVVGKINILQMPQQQQGMQQMQMGGQQPKFGTYIRLGGGNEVYEIDGALTWDVSKAASDWRNTDIIKFSQYQLSKLETRGPISLTLEKDTTNNWNANGADLDSAQMANYISGIMGISSKEFNDAIEEISDAPKVEIYLTDKDGASSKLMAYQQDGDYVLQSSDVQGSYFKITQQDFDKLIPPVTALESLEEAPVNP